MCVYLFQCLYQHFFSTHMILHKRSMWVFIAFLSGLFSLIFFLLISLIFLIPFLLPKCPLFCVQKILTIFESFQASNHVFLNISVLYTSFSIHHMAEAVFAPKDQCRFVTNHALFDDCVLPSDRDLLCGQ